MRIAILGYGNLGHGVECAVRQNEDITLSMIFTRRDPASVSPVTKGLPVYDVRDIESHLSEFDVLIICSGSATDLPEQTPKYAKLTHVVDSFDTHARIPEHFDAVDRAARSN
ncbi:MAG: diaminopimelate dehydrogenase, partial [Clostridia bacterium]|nr:diaminopimelate dehydrogenase [Clostridia bacterium]